MLVIAAFSRPGDLEAVPGAGYAALAAAAARTGTDPANLASRRLDDLLTGLAEIPTAARTLLRPDDIAVITTRPWRQRGELVDFPGAVLATGADGLLDRRRASCRGYPLFHIHARPQLCGG